MRFLDLSIVVILGLVCARLARIIAVDKIGEPVRQWLYRHQAKRWLGGWLYSLITCPWCISVHAALWSVLWWIWLILPTWPGWGEFLVAWWAVAGAASVILSIDIGLHKWIDMPAPGDHDE
jgi:hypothetical protein